MKTNTDIKKCAWWLQQCLLMGYKKSDFPELEKIYYKFKSIYRGGFIMKTPFYELAEKIAEDMDDGRPTTFYAFGFRETVYFIDVFESTFVFESLNHCVVCLLFADLLWQEEMKGGMK